MADDDDMVEPDEELEPDESDEVELDGPDLDEDLDAEELVDELEDDLDDDFVAVEDDVEDDDAKTAGPVRKSVAAGEDEDDDDDMIAPDDVEADLDTILKDRLVAVDDDAGEDEDEEPEERGESADRLQPKRADEQLCSNCFLLVRQTAPGCPVGDDACPLFPS
jgi:hypothetical protein